MWCRLIVTSRVKVELRAVKKHGCVTCFLSLALHQRKHQCWTTEALADIQEERCYFQPHGQVSFVGAETLPKGFTAAM